MRKSLWIRVKLFWRNDIPILLVKVKSAEKVTLGEEVRRFHLRWSKYRNFDYFSLEHS